MTDHHVRETERSDGGPATEQAKEKTKEATERAREQTEQGREQAAGGAESAAEKIREQSEGRGGTQEKVGAKAADTMERTATYLRENRTDELWGDLERMAREHPMQALGGALAAGFLVGRILR